MNRKRRSWAVLFCLFIALSFLAVPVSASNMQDFSIYSTGVEIRLVANAYQGNINHMNDFAYRAYKIIRSIVCPMAIVSFASCGYKVLGSIFFGNVDSAAGTDIMKARRQFVLTILAIIFVVALPDIFSYAQGVFKSTAWEP